MVDMEFVQFHPTALGRDDDPMVLISEAVRGEGARLVNDAGEPLWSGVHPMADLAPRDIVARAIFRQMQAGRQVYLDASSDRRAFRRPFPHDLPGVPGAGHRSPRGSRYRSRPRPTSSWAASAPTSYGRTGLPGLYACGEVACTGVHGANRLASNSLLEGLVFAERIARSLATSSPAAAVPAAPQSASIPSGRIFGEAAAP